MNESKCKICRREGTKLFLKGARCMTAKCSFSKRMYPPGLRSFRRKKQSEYARQIREKQKVKRFYGVNEQQFRRYFKMAEAFRGNTGERLLNLLERRLDNVVCRLGYAHSRSEARQIIRHGHIQLNGRKSDIPSIIVEPKDVIDVKGKDKSRKLVNSRIEVNKDNDIPQWLSKEEGTKAIVAAMPSREDVSVETEEQLIVEICSR